MAPSRLTGAAGADAGRRVRPVGRQLQHGHAAQDALPVLHAAAELAVCQARAVPGHIVDISRSQSRLRGLLPGCCAVLAAHRQ